MPEAKEVSTTKDCDVGDQSVVMSRPEAIQVGVDLARGIFECGDERGRPASRIQFKSGKWPDSEVDNGGFCESALATTITDLLLKRQFERTGQTASS